MNRTATVNDRPSGDHDTTHLLVAEDRHLAWLLGEVSSVNGLREPPGGVDDGAVLIVIRDLVARLHAAGYRSHWLIVNGSEVVGLCGLKRPPSPSGEAEIGYGVAESRRRRGFATRAVALVLSEAARLEGVSALVAETAADNLASQVVLERNGLVRTGMRHDREDGDLILWSRSYPT